MLEREGEALERVVFEEPVDMDTLLEDFDLDALLYWEYQRPAMFVEVLGLEGEEADGGVGVV